MQTYKLYLNPQNKKYMFLNREYKTIRAPFKGAPVVVKKSTISNSRLFIFNIFYIIYPD